MFEDSIVIGSNSMASPDRESMKSPDDDTQSLEKFYERLKEIRKEHGIFDETKNANKTEILSQEEQKESIVSPEKMILDEGL